MKIILTHDVPKVGQRGTLVDVAAGFGRNFLIRKGLGRLADAQAIHEARAREEKLVHMATAKQAEQKSYRQKLKDLTLTFERKANTKGHLFAAVSAEDVLEALHKAGFSLITRSDVTGIPLKETGEHYIELSVGGIEVAVHVIISAI